MRGSEKERKTKKGRTKEDKKERDKQRETKRGREWSEKFRLWNWPRFQICNFSSEWLVPNF